jgi:hypothetical protein
MLSLECEPHDLPAGDMLAYKSLPSVSVAMDGGPSVPYSRATFDNATHALTLGLEVPDGAAAFGLQRANLVEIPLDLVTL